MKKIIIACVSRVSETRPGIFQDTWYHKKSYLPQLQNGHIIKAVQKYYLEEGPVRFNELQRRMPKMTHATLSVQLKSLVENGLVQRKQYETVPTKVEYSLTEIGREFRPVMDALQEWAQKYIERMNP